MRWGGVLHFFGLGFGVEVEVAELFEGDVGFVLLKVRILKLVNRPLPIDLVFERPQFSGLVLRRVPQREDLIVVVVLVHF